MAGDHGPTTEKGKKETGLDAVESCRSSTAAAEELWQATVPRRGGGAAKKKPIFKNEWGIYWEENTLLTRHGASGGARGAPAPLPLASK